MTIAVGVASPEGLVVATDSRSSILIPTGLGMPGFRVATDYTHKVFALREEFAVATFGWATLEGKTIAGVVKEFEAQTVIPDDIDQVANLLRDFFQERIQAHIAAGHNDAPDEGVEPVGFIIAGYDSDGVGRLKRIFPYGGTVIDLFQTTDPGAIWNGETDVLGRLLAGYDALRLDTEGWPTEHKAALDSLQYITPFGWYALQDAVDFASFVVRTTIDAQRFTNGTMGAPGGAQTCGGSVEIVAISPGEGLRWVQRTVLK
ncbi:MAG: hypothetical protein ACXVRS_16605 [Gaiellaceae bacterium]